jgi:alginate O-acetyltransferase complex protein AlgI
MLFCTQAFLLFFTVVFLVYWALPWQRARVWLLLAASFYFYANWNRWLAIVVCLSGTMDYLIARGMDATQRPRRRKMLLIVSVVGNLAVLLYFKYANFFLRSLEEALQAAGATAALPVLEVMIPVGISFYTFEAISYTVDVYRRRIRAERRLSNFMLFILFFPHLNAGPIVRARDFLPQISRAKRWSWARGHLGGRYLLLGLIKKLVVADRLAVLADPVFAQPSAYATGVLWMATVAYAIQIYCDFSGYSDMALGSAHLLGYKLAINFNLPYLAANMAEFWRRWHISLSSWLRDYVFIPLGGSRGTRWLLYRNLLITMTLCGLWHGAKWPPVVFGALQGLYLIGHHAFRDVCKRLPSLDALLQTAAGTVGRVAVTFFFFLCSLVVFRTLSLQDGATMLRRMFSQHSGQAAALAPSVFWSLILLVAVGHACGVWGKWMPRYQRLPAPVRGLGYAAALALTLLLMPVASKTFIYFQF